MQHPFKKIVDTPLGPLTIVGGDAGIAVASFAPVPGYADLGKNDVVEAFAAEVAAYFSGSLRKFATVMNAPGTEFQREVWRALGDIPYGATTTYSEIARALGKPDAVRAVGTANGANPIAIAVPCHRVIGADGTLTGYAGGLERKRFLLDHEQKQAQSAKQPSLF